MSKFKKGDLVRLTLKKGEEPSHGCGGYDRLKDYNAEGEIISRGGKSYHINFPFQMGWIAEDYEIELICDIPENLFVM